MSNNILIFTDPKENSTPKKQKQEQKTPKKEANGTPAKPEKKGKDNSAATPMKGDKTPKKEKEGKGAANTPAKQGKTPKR